MRHLEFLIYMILPSVNPRNCQFLSFPLPQLCNFLTNIRQHGDNLLESSCYFGVSDPENRFQP